jgi:senataxin
VGDPRQLPATILSPIAERARLGQSLFERLERAGHEVVMLQTQYRMHPAIRQFPADRFYNGMLVDGDGIKDEVRVYMDAAAQSSASLSRSGHGHASGRAALSRSFLEHAIVTAPYVQYDTNEGRSSTHVHAGSQAALGKPSRGLKPANFFNLRNGREEQAGKSFCNPAEADYIAAFLDDLIVRVRQTIPEGMSTNTTIGIISPYKAQVNMLNRRLRRHLHRPHDSHRPSQATAARGPSGGPSGDMNGGREVDVEVNTVDGFQGREKDIIIISCVRCRKDGTSMPGSGGSHAALGAPSDSANANGQRARTKSGIGFVADARRLNVAITRARKCLVIVGSAETLRVDGNWHAMLRSFEARALITPVSVPYTSVLHAL